MRLAGRNASYVFNRLTLITQSKHAIVVHIHALVFKETSVSAQKPLLQWRS
ncbi:hypothetical protein [Bartonella henselae]|uniref:hypothetical protein n=1 Tax=Bartonella henselae TaxID=38323 RepID=UPI0004ADE069|nr:hypothetical protein [Bartonella henselae]MDM9984044.1 hypothetical protein [Bartonella henselae]MDM9985525.1 hypothetical protein [Bartonella henselae]MDM9987045.1 hypothetical protein [Bartonella henselae]MDM9988497.1 hypothetical protein [Bartonella henselae]MDM9989965.1 hypothetical protein [Bartonella henselae]